MKTMFAMVTVGAVMLGGLLLSSQVQAEPEAQPLDEAAVNARVDARLHQVLLGLRAQTHHRG